MKIKRYKKADRYMSLYKNNFGFREPYQVLLDGTFCQVALAHKVNIQEQLPKYLHGQCKLLTTSCVKEETRRLGKPLHGAHLIVSQFPTHDCGHEEPISASKCLSSFIIDSRNRDHYLVATQDHKLRTKIANNAICPLLKLANNSIVLDKPTQKIQSKTNRTHHFLANKMTDEERSNLDRLKEEENLVDKDRGVDSKRKRKKGPNPLSCRKKSSKVSTTRTSSKKDEGPSGKKRHRKRVRLASHIKKLIQEAGSKKPLTVENANSD